MTKLPPEEKIYEAWTAVADGRVEIDNEKRTAYVKSSDGTKTYTISWNEDRSVYSSNDNASFWRGYAGYPVIAVMMLQGTLPLDRTIAELYREVNRKKLNTEYHRNHAAAVAETEALRDIDPEESLKAAKAVMVKLMELPATIIRSRAEILDNA